jgi:hypothetical protein
VRVIRFFLEQNNLAPSTINVRLAAVPRLTFEAADTGLLGTDLTAVFGASKVRSAFRFQSYHSQHRNGKIARISCETANFHGGNPRPKSCLRALPMQH